MSDLQRFGVDASVVPLGYKWTEVGVIPEDWEVGNLIQFCHVTDCKHLTAKFSWSGFPVASIREVQSRFVDLSNAKYTTKKYYESLIEGGRKPRAGDLIISRNATVGAIAQVADWHPPFAMGQDVCLLRKKSSNISTELLYSIFNSFIIDKQLSNLMVGSTFKRINIKQIQDFYVPLPPPKEQTAIANALSDVDALLDSLDQLITKKGNLKQATMQQLLTGKIRLEGFMGEWEVMPLENIANIRSGGTPSTSNPEFWNNDVVWCTPTDITALQGQKYLTKTERTISLKGLRASSAEIIPPYSIIMTSRATIGECAINTIPMTTNQGFKNLIPLNVDAEFLYYLMLTKKQFFLQLCSGSTFLEISKKQLQTLELRLPKDIKEQTAIATILSDMDAEIQALEKRRAKTHDLKQAMMQELLTGKTRIVDS